MQKLHPNRNTVVPLRGQVRNLSQPPGERSLASSNLRPAISSYLKRIELNENSGTLRASGSCKGILEKQHLMRGMRDKKFVSLLKRVPNKVNLYTSQRHTSTTNSQS